MTTAADIVVMIVDDNRQMRVLTRSLLRAAGVNKVIDAESAEDALEAMRRFPVDIVLLDWKMAPMNGLDFTLKVRRAPDSPNPYVPILMMTAHTEQSRVAAARDAGVTGFLRKPVSARALFDRLQTALLDQRMFVKTAEFFGPDRRHERLPDYPGPFRRESDGSEAPLDTLDIDDDVRNCA
ncbi:chemotaxis protein cheYIII [alpha proteobacterium U9-1i]|nr:chemotaxis protein cheYIII [alpha proteobacterium U9-1i]